MIYLDILFFTNWMIDYLILVLVKKDFFPGTGNRRVAVGAFLAAGTYLLWFVRAGSAPEAIRGAAAICLVGMILWWTFSVRSLRQFLQAACAALGYTCLMGGACYALRRFPGSTVLPEGWTTAAGCAAVFLFSRSVGKRMKKEAVKQRECTYEVEIRRKDRTVFLQGMYDSGNRLESRWTGEGICVLSLKSAEGLLDEKEKEMLAFLVTRERFSLENHDRESVVGYHAYLLLFCGKGGRLDARDHCGSYHCKKRRKGTCRQEGNAGNHRPADLPGCGGGRFAAGRYL